MKRPTECTDSKVYKFSFIPKLIYTFNIIFVKPHWESLQEGKKRRT